MIQILDGYCVGLPYTALDGVEFQGSIDSPPEVVIADRDHVAKPFPLPTVFAPVGELTADPTAHVTAASKQRDLGGTVQRFEAADHSEQFQSATIGAGFRIGCGETFFAADRLQREFPVWCAVAGTVRFGVEQIMGEGGVHERWR